MLVSGVQQSDSVIHIYMYILFHIHFHYSLLQDIEYNSLFYTVGSCCLSILYIVVCIYWNQDISQYQLARILFFVVHNVSFINTILDFMKYAMLLLGTLIPVCVKSH